MNLLLYILGIIGRFFAGCVGAWFNFFFDKSRTLGMEVTVIYCKIRKFYLFNWIISGGVIALAFDAPIWQQAFLVGFGLRAIYEQVLGEPKEENVERFINKIVDEAKKESDNKLKELDKIIDKK